MESGVHAAVPLRVGKKMRKRRELDALVGGGVARGGRLLSASSDEGEPWARRSTRRRRSRPFLRLAAALALAVCVVSAATVLWLFVDVRRQIVSLRMEMDRVSTSSQGASDELQICHSAVKMLKINASDFSNRIAELQQNYEELVKRIEKTEKALEGVSGQLDATPGLRETPQKLSALQKLVADFGAQLKTYDTSIANVKKQATTAQSGVEETKTLLHQLEARTNETIANVTANAKLEDQIKLQVSSVNATLEEKVESLRTRIEDLSKTTSTVPPTTTTSTTTTTTPSTTTNGTTILPGPPAKPSVLH